MKKAVTVCLILILAFLSAACSQGGTASNTPNKTDEAVQTVTDCIGREVELPENVDRVAALYSPAGHITVMLGHGSSIVATSNGLQRDKMLHEICPDIKKASVVKVSGDFNTEELVALDVDVVLLSYDMYLDTKAVKKLDEFGIPYMVVAFNSIEEQKQLVNILADVFNEEHEAGQYCDFYDKIVSLTTKALADLPDEKKIRVYHSINEAVATVGKNTLPEDWMKVAGGVDVSLNGSLTSDNDKYYTTLEQILVWDPEVIICNVEGTDEYIRTQPAWTNIQAVKNSRVYLMPVGISRWGHTTSIETPLAILWTAKTLYPDYCKDIDMDSLIREFYSTLFEFDVSDEQIKQILAGKGMRLSKELE